MNLLCQSAPLSTETKVHFGTVADRRQAELTKWKQYAGAAPTGQAVTATNMPRTR